ncbi:hypothetical protein BJ741DRAFT_585831 [Chytriomyces cf. hyalinus JEL632]|nr:hypothetical protein BJ741DRAFT_585831 [Chytriomyces cf. hyalinus JEL632]
MASSVVSAVIINFSPASTENPTNARPSTTPLVVALVAVNLFVLTLVAIVAFKIDTRRRRMNEAAAAEKADLESQHALPMAQIHAQQQHHHLDHTSCPVPVVYLPPPAQVVIPIISNCDYQSESNSYSTTDLSMQESPLHADYEYQHHHHHNEDDLEDETSLYSLTVSEMAEFFALSPPEVSDLTLLAAPIVAERVALYHHVPLGVGLGITF